MFLVADLVHRCRNKGGTDVTFCEETSSLNTNNEVDLVCGDKKPLYRYCQISALHDIANGPYYTYSEYSWFTKSSANAACEDIGGSLPQIKKNIDGFFLRKVMKYLSDFVKLETPFSLKWLTWPVCMVPYITGYV